MIIVVWSRCQQKLNRGISSRVINPDIICTVSTASLQILIYSQKEGDNTGMDTKPETEFIVDLLCSYEVYSYSNVLYIQSSILVTLT